MPINFENVSYQEMSLSLWALKHRERVIVDGGTVGSEEEILSYLQLYWSKYNTLANITYSPHTIFGFKYINTTIKLYSLQEKFDLIVNTVPTGSTYGGVEDITLSGSTLNVEYGDGMINEIELPSTATSLLIASEYDSTTTTGLLICTEYKV